ncbi:MAG: putative TetR family transcriptional regulator [Ilumatobacteraceae bacterium]|nr:putative TetR family transcriptional regulator [Ilumatobacteraceae bacterium]
MSTRPATVSDGPPDPATLIPSQRLRRDRIVHQAMRMLERREYEEIQMRDVAERADVAVGTVYRYFQSKEHLFAAVLVEWSASLHTRVQRDPLIGDDIPAQLADLVHRVVVAFERLPQFFRLIVTLETTPDKYARLLYDEFASRTNETFVQPLGDLDPAEAAAIVNVLMAVLGAVMRSWARGAIGPDVVEARLNNAVQLIFSAPPKPARSRKPAVSRRSAPDPTPRSVRAATRAR